MVDIQIVALGRGLALIEADILGASRDCADLASGVIAVAGTPLACSQRSCEAAR